MANRQSRTRPTAARQRARRRAETPSDDARLDRTFAALSDPTRRAILAQLAEEDALPAGRLAEGFDMAWPSVSKHLRVLEGAGLLRQEKDGRVRRCHLEAEPLKEAAVWIAYYRKFWGDRLDALAAFFEGEAG
ncbi:MAG: metalloregulator ArsR/SmtB family transcription factor [Planctomycetota bacterium]